MNDLDIYDSNLQIQEKNVIKRVMKKVIRKAVLPLIKPYIDFQNSTNLKLQNYIEQTKIETNKELNNIIERMEQENSNIHKEFLQEFEKNEKKVFAHLDKFGKDLGAVARQIMLVKWRQIDSQLSVEEKSTDILTCKICGYSQKRGDYELKETDCIFNGGHLVRYVCPECGVIFGPTKFLALGQAGIDEDYWVHYLGFSEGDSSYKEERAFFMLKPDKEKIYLNYGCGHWSKSLQNLREQGYQVYGYEPYSPDIDNPYMITSKEQLMKMRFDGIYSNDVLEHMINPIEDLKFMRSILLNSDSKMSHCTGCYNYKYEYTRFHTFFYLGESVKIMSEKSGFKIVDFCDDVEKNDFICYVYAPDGDIDLIDKMSIKDNVSMSENCMVINVGEEGIVYGPYLTLSKGVYALCICIEGEADNIICKITADKGKNELENMQLKSGINKVRFVLEQETKNIEFVIQSKKGNIVIKKIFFTK